MTRAVRPRSAPRVRSSAKALRKRMTPAEARRWVHLRDVNRNGARFRRQVPIGPFVVDFACLRHRIVVEVDGSGHAREDARARDARRDAYLAAQGFTVLRAWNDEVLRRLDAVIADIYAAMGVRALATGAN